MKPSILSFRSAQSLTLFFGLRQLLQQQSEMDIESPQVQLPLEERIFHGLGKPSNPKGPHRNETILAECLMGHLFVRSYRTFIKNPTRCVMTLFKLVNNGSEYLYLKILRSQNQPPSLQQLATIQQAILDIDSMRGRPQDNYRVLFCFLDDVAIADLPKHQYLEWKKKGGMIEATAKWGASVNNEQEKLGVGDYQLGKVKELLWAYVDTFGARYLSNAYYDLERRNPTTHNIAKLINTLNWLVCNQTLNQPYNQLETANWTCFEIQAREKLKSDRKDLVFSGSGRILIIHLILTPSPSNAREVIGNCKRNSTKQMHDMLYECKKSYAEAKVKVYVISDQLIARNLIYYSESSQITQFPSPKNSLSPQK